MYDTIVGVDIRSSTKEGLDNINFRSRWLNLAQSVGKQWVFVVTAYICFLSFLFVIGETPLL